MTDSNHWLPKSKLEKIKLALLNLQELYPEIDIPSMYAGGKEGDERYLKEAFPVEWVLQWPLGDATFYAGQFSYLFQIMNQPHFCDNCRLSTFDYTHLAAVFTPCAFRCRQY